MTSLQDNNNAKIPQDEESMPTSSMNREMSIATRRYAGEKGYLDEDDKIIRKYDKDGDGKFTIDEAKSMAADFRSAIMSKELYQKVIVGMAVLLVVSWAGNFGLTFATVSLTEQLDTQGGDLTDTEGHMLATKSKGDSVQFIPEFSSENPADLRHLQVGTGVHFGTISKTRADARSIWNDHGSGATVSVTYELDGVNHASSVQLGTQELDVPDDNDVDGTCDVYEGIQVDDSSRTFKVYCCGGDTQLCDVFDQVTPGRSLGCFSPMSTVIEQTKGKMFIKDLKFGDSVLAANQVFQPFMLNIHSHPSKSAEFIQVHTELSGKDPETAPIELSPGHMIFIEGKDLPVRASEVKVSDSLVGTSGPTKVTKITTVTRDGMFDPLTGDATLYVDGVLASSVAVGQGEDYVNFGLFKFHSHTFTSRVGGPLFRMICTKVDSKHCETQVDDGAGGAMNIVMKSVLEHVSQDWSIQLKSAPRVRLGFLLLPATAAITLFSYLALIGLAPVAFVMSVFMAIDIAKKQSASSSKNKMA